MNGIHSIEFLVLLPKITLIKLCTNLLLAKKILLKNAFRLIGLGFRKGRSFLVKFILINSWEKKNKQNFFIQTIGFRTWSIYGINRNESFMIAIRK